MYKKIRRFYIIPSFLCQMKYYIAFSLCVCVCIFAQTWKFVWINYIRSRLMRYMAHTNKKGKQFFLLPKIHQREKIRQFICRISIDERISTVKIVWTKWEGNAIQIWRCLDQIEEEEQVVKVEICYFLIYAKSINFVTPLTLSE